MKDTAELETNCYNTGFIARNLREDAKEKHGTNLDVGTSYIAAAILMFADRQAKAIQEAMKNRD